MSVLSQSSEIRPSVEANSLAEKAAIEEIKGERNNDVLKQAWIQLANQLEIEGIPKEKISTIGQQLIIDQKKQKLTSMGIPPQELESVSVSGWWREVMREIGCTDPNKNTSATEPPQENSSINTKNTEVIDILLQTKSICDLAIKKFKEYPELDEIFGKKETREFFRQWRTIINNCKYAFDEKTKVPQNTEQILLECLTTSSGSLSEGAHEFMQTRIKLLKNQGKSILTAKQGKKFQTGDKASQLPLLFPTTRDTAVFLDYFGVQCTCDSWRVRSKPDTRNVECYDCGKEFAAKTVSKCRYCQLPLYKADLKHIVDTWQTVEEENSVGDSMSGGHCPNCNTINRLPEELITYANS
jgi:hypothetical protein